MKVYFDVQGALTIKGEDNTEHLALGVWAERFLGGDAPLTVKREVPRSDDQHKWVEWETQKLYASKEGRARAGEWGVADGDWKPASEFPPKAGRYEVHGAPQGKRSFYFDGAHWHLHDESRAPGLEMRSYGCPGPRWRSECTS